MTKAGERLIAAAKSLRVPTDEHVWGGCDYLQQSEGEKCKRCPRTEKTSYGSAQRMCFGLALETINKVDELRTVGR